jgi:polysaccharide export outer membrane protein
MRPLFRLFHIVAALAAGFAVPLAGASAQDAAQQSEYILGPGDVVEVNLLGREDFKTRGRVRPDGTILLPFLGSVAAGQRTPTQLGETVSAGLRSGGYYSNPVVSVDIVSYASRYVTVLGLVKNPGLVPVDRAYRVSEILARVGGTSESSADHVVWRPSEGQERELKIVALATGSDEQDPFVSPGDKLFVPQAQQFFIYGQVNSPGAYPLMSEPTLRKALARGGGLTALGTERKIRIIRGGQEVRSASLAEGLQPGDVIVVGERLF